MRILRGAGQVDREKWLSFLESSPYGSPFQSPVFFDAVNSAPGPQAAEVFALESGGRFEALCVATLQKEKGLKGFFSRRAIVYGGPLLSGGEASNWALLSRAVEDALRRQAIYLEVRNFHDYRAVYPVYEAAHWQYLPYLNVQLPLQGRSPEGILAGMKYNRRREIRLSTDAGALCRPAESEEEAHRVYGILAGLYRERVKLPLPGWDFFRRLFFSEVGRVLVVQHGGEPIGGAFCLAIGGQGIYTFYYCGLRNYHNKIFPTHLAVWGAIECGLREGLKYLDFMGVGLKGEAYGVRQYKMEFGGELKEQGRFLKVLNYPLYQIGRLGLAALQKVK